MYLIACTTDDKYLRNDDQRAFCLNEEYDLASASLEVFYLNEEKKNRSVIWTNAIDVNHSLHNKNREWLDKRVHNIHSVSTYTIHRSHYTYLQIIIIFVSFDMFDIYVCLMSVESVFFKRNRKKKKERQKKKATHKSTVTQLVLVVVTIFY